MPGQDSTYQSAHEIGKIYHSIADRKLLCDFFLESVLKFINAAEGYLFLTGRDDRIWLESQVGNLPPNILEKLSSQAEAVLKEGKPMRGEGSMFFPLIVRNSAIGVACFFSDPKTAALTQQDSEIASDLCAQLAGALKNILLFEENLKMERLAAIGQTVGMVIHEIKNIMLLASLSEEFIKMGVKDKNENMIGQGLEKMGKALREMNGFVWEMLSLTKEYKLTPTQVNFNKLLEELKNDLLPRATDRNIVLDFQCEEDFPDVYCDARAIFRALLNLVKNAMEACDKKGAYVRIRVNYIDSKFYEITVSDNGQGMNDKTQAKLFEAFFSTKGQNGNGLGLMVVDRTVKMHQGKVTVASELGNGTTFTLTLPKLAVQAEAA